MPITPVIDHAVINVDEELDQAQSLFQRMGFQLSTRGHHSMGSSNHLAIFADNYLELLGYEPARQTDSRGLWNVAPGLAGLVWKTRDAHAVWRHLQQCQLDGEPPTRFFRPVILPDAVRLRPGSVSRGSAPAPWHTASVFSVNIRRRKLSGSPPGKYILMAYRRCPRSLLPRRNLKRRWRCIVSYSVQRPVRKIAAAMCLIQEPAACVLSRINKPAWSLRCRLLLHRHQRKWWRSAFRWPHWSGSGTALARAIFSGASRAARCW